MPDWTRSMSQNFEYYIVDPNTWYEKEKLQYIESCSISWDLGALTLGSASFKSSDNIGECYIRVYLVTTQDKITERFALGTFLVQSPSLTYDGKRTSVTVDAYTPLIELKESHPPIGYSALKDDNIMDLVCSLADEHSRAPVVYTPDDGVLETNLVANIDDTWMDFLTDLLVYNKKTFALDEKSKIMFAPYTDITKMQPVWTYKDDNSSILQRDITIESDLYGIPNVVEVVSSVNGAVYAAVVKNEDEHSITSIQNRGREIIYRDTNPSIPGRPSQAMVDEYAANLLEQLSTVQYTLSYRHGYCPVRIGDCVLLSYESAGLHNVKARVQSQTIDCVSGCQVSETAVYVTKLWEAS